MIARRVANVHSLMRRRFWDSIPIPDLTNFLTYLNKQSGSNLIDYLGNMDAIINEDGTIDFHPTTNNDTLYEIELMGGVGDLDANYLSFWNVIVGTGGSISIQSDGVVGDFVRLIKGTKNTYIYTKSNPLSINTTYKKSTLLARGVVGTQVQVWFGTNIKTITLTSSDWTYYSIDNPSSNSVNNTYIFVPGSAGVTIDVADLRVYEDYTISDYFNKYISSHSLNADNVYYPQIKLKKKWAMKYINPAEIALGDMIIITDSANRFFILRTSFNSTKDLAFVFCNNVAETNSEVDFCNVFLINKSTTNNYTSISSGILIAGQSDDTCPMNYNGTYIGAGHGNAAGRKITMPTHGKTNEDIGSEWIDSSSHKWYIIKIVDANNLIVMSENYGTSDKWLFYTSISSNLTHVSGATHTADIVIGTPVLYQIPCEGNHTKTFWLDGTYKMTELVSSAFNATYFEVREEFDIVNQHEMLQSLIARVGSSSEPDFYDASSQIHHTISYKYYKNGAMIIDYDIDVNQAVDLNYFGFIQHGVLNNPTGYPNTKMCIPNTLPITVGARTWDLRRFEDYNSANAPTGSIYIGSAYWEDANRPPSRQIQYIADGSNVPLISFAMGYHPSSDIWQNRKDLVSLAWYIYTTRKSYPHGIDNKISLDAGQSYSARLFRQFYDINYAGKGNATSVMWHEVDGDTYLFIDYHQVSTNDVITLPSELSNKTITVIEKSDTMIITSTSINADGELVVSCDDVYGHATIKLT